MTSLPHPSPDPVYDRIAARVAHVGVQFHRQQVLCGAMIWLGGAAVATVAAGAAAHWFGTAHGSAKGIGILWISWLLASALVCVLRPLLLRPAPLSVAARIEARVTGLHNGLTNALHLARRDDVADSPWLRQIYQEILRAAETRPVGDAVRMSDLRTPALRLGAVLLTGAIVSCVFHAAIGNGFRQIAISLLQVPNVGITNIRADAQHVATNPVTVEALTVHITPPPYTAEAERSVRVHLTDGNGAAEQIVVPEGSWIDVECATRGPAVSASLETGDGASNLPMRPSSEPERLIGSLTVRESVRLRLILKDAAGGTLARIPDEPLAIECLKDRPPEIQLRWPARDVVVPSDSGTLTVTAVLHDDHGLTRARVLIAHGPGATTRPAPADEWAVVGDETYHGRAGADAPVQLAVPLTLPTEARRSGSVIRVRVEATDNRELSQVTVMPENQTRPGAMEKRPQLTVSPVVQIRFADRLQIAEEQKRQDEALRRRLEHLLKVQTDLHRVAAAANVMAPDFKASIAPVSSGQSALRDEMKDMAETFPFGAKEMHVQKTLQMLVGGLARDAVELSLLLGTEPDVRQRAPLQRDLVTRQRRIMAVLETLMVASGESNPSTTRPAIAPVTRPSNADLAKKLDAALKEFIAQQQRVLDQTTDVAGKRMKTFAGGGVVGGGADTRMVDLALAQEKVSAFMQEMIRDLTKVAEQDMSLTTLVSELEEVQSEVTMAKDALQQKAIAIAVPAEQNGVELATKIEHDLPRWLSDRPDRTKWTQEDPPEKIDVPMPELPRHIQDIIGKLFEQEEDLFQDIEDGNANWLGSFDKDLTGVAMDGPVANVTAKGVTGNQLPNDNDMVGRSGEGRTARSSGEMVDDRAVGKGGRRTPTRLDPTPYQPGEVKDTGTGAVGGATGGGKLSGQGGAGLTGPPPPAVQAQMQRLANKQAELRNTAERFNLQHGLARYDQFKLAKATALMRRVESDLRANRYDNALRRRDVLLDALDESQVLVGAQVHVQQDATPAGPIKVHDDVSDVVKGELPQAWKDALKAYFRKLGQN